MPLASSSRAGVVSVVLLLLLANASSCDSIEGRRVLSDEPGGGVVASWRRSTVESPVPGANSSSPGNNSLALAAERTHRGDPLANGETYYGGWNISDTHYWASVAYSAAPLALVAGLWFVGFGVALLVISCCCCCCCRRCRKTDSHSPLSYHTTLILLIIFTAVTVVWCGRLHGGLYEFHSSTISTVDYVVGQGNLTVETLRQFAGSLAAAKNVRVDEIFLPVELQQKIDIIEEKVNSSANAFSNQTLNNSVKIKHVVDRMKYDLLVVGIVMFSLAVLGFLFSVLGWHFFVTMLVIGAWIVLTVTILMSAGFLLLHNVVADTCVAMDEWVTHPQAHTALDDILPCVDAGTAKESMHRSEEVTVQLVALVNNVIVNISNRDFPPVLTPLYFNQSGPLVPTLCSPFNPDMTPRTCGPGEVNFDAAPEVWKRFECQVAGPPGAVVCTTVGRLTPPAYEQMTAATSVSRGLYRYGPFLMDLHDCTFVRQTLAAISRNNCPGLEQSSRQVYLRLLVISGAVMLSIFLWMLHTRQRGPERRIG